MIAAQAGDRRALDELVTAHLPFVYTIVRRALSGHPDTDDVVQETMLRVLRELPSLRTPDSFRAWLAMIAVRQVSTHLHRRRTATVRSVNLDDIVEMPDAEAEFEGLTMLRLELSGQRRQVVRASGWLDQDDRTLLSLWWLEIAGQLTRAELAQAIGVSVAHAGVRIQRMRGQLELARALVAAIDAEPGCPRLAGVLASWGGRPSPLWRKRIARHVQSCPVCSPTTADRVATERLLVGYALLPVPLALGAGLLGKIALGGAVAGTSSAALGSAVGAGATGSLGAGAKAGVLSQLIQMVVAHPVVAGLVAATVVTGTAVTTTKWPTSAPPAHAVIAAPATVPASAGVPLPTSLPSTSVPRPSPSPTRLLSPGRVSLESANDTGYFVSTADTDGLLAPVSTSSDSHTRQQATFEVVAGLADSDCFSFRLPDGTFLRHSYWRLRVFANDGSALFRGDATFCPRPGPLPGTILLESANYPGWFLHRRGLELWVDHTDKTAAFLADSAFRVRAALTG